MLLPSNVVATILRASLGYPRGGNLRAHSRTIAAAARIRAQSTRGPPLAADAALRLRAPAAGSKKGMATQTFAAWLAAQDTRSDEVGELAKHVAGLGDFPDSGGKAIYDGYFETDRSSRREVFERAWAEFS